MNPPVYPPNPTATPEVFETPDIWRAAFCLCHGYSLIEVLPGITNNNKRIFLEVPKGVDHEELQVAFRRRDAFARLAALAKRAAQSSPSEKADLLPDVLRYARYLVDPHTLVTEYKRLKNEFDQTDVNARRAKA